MQQNTHSERSTPDQVVSVKPGEAAGKTAGFTVREFWASLLDMPAWLIALMLAVPMWVYILRRERD
jgi:hypothetical protein